MKHLVIVGSGMAGVTATQEARKLHSQEELKITLISKEKPPSYSRPQLTKLLAGLAKEDQIIFRSNQWFSAQGVTLICPACATKILRQEKKIIIQHRINTINKGQFNNTKQEEISYDALILATGAFPFAPLIPDSTSPAFDSVFTLRTIEDVKNIRQHLVMKRKSTAVLGGGLLGLELARALKATGVAEVHVLESSGYLLNKQLNRTASEMLRLYLEREEDLIIHTGVHVDTNELKHQTVAETLKSICGSGVETLIYSMGVRSHIHLAQEAAINCNKGIIINEETATNDPSIFAAGDCAEFQDITWAIIPAALEQGKKAAQFACYHIFGQATNKPMEKPSPYRQTIPRTTITVGKREALSAGKAVLSPEEENSGNWRNQEISPPKKRGDTNDTYVNLIEEVETETIIGALAFGPEGTIAKWFSQLQQMIGKQFREITIEGVNHDSN